MKIRRALILACPLGILLLLALPAVVQAQFTFTTNDDNTITLTQYTGSNNVVIIPATTNGYPVTSIGDAAFSGCVNLASIEFPGSITNIGSGAFNSCFGLTIVAIPAGVNTIGDYAFFYCTNLTVINVDEANLNYSSADGVLFNKDRSILLQFPSGKGGSYSIPSSVTRLADEAFGLEDHGFYQIYFSSCAGLTNLIIPSSITNIEDYAFSHCTGLKSVTLSDGIASIGVEAFSWCTNLSRAAIPDSVTSIGNLAFYYSDLTNATISSSVTNLRLQFAAVWRTSPLRTASPALGRRGSIFART